MPVAEPSPELSVVIPVHDEEPVLAACFERLTAVLDSLELRSEIVAVDDGSRDGSLAWLRQQQARDPRLLVVALSRKFGKEAALSAGLDHARGAAVVPLDADLQDPPELIPALIERWREGYDVVYGIRQRGRGDRRLRRLTAWVFYRLLRALSRLPIPSDAGDFRLLDRRVVEVLRHLPERGRYLRGLFTWVGFRQIGIPYRREARSLGHSSYRTRHLLALAWDGITAFSTAPLRIWSWLGLFTTVAVLITAAALALRANHPLTLSTVLTLALLLMNGLLLCAVGTVGEYVARIHREVTGRPLYVVKDVHPAHSE